MKERYELIHHLAYEMAKDEVFREELFQDEDELRWLNGCVVEFHDDFIPVYQRWLNYFEQTFKLYEL